MMMLKREGEVRIPSGCAIAAVISREGKGITGDLIAEAMKPMHDRSNGLGGGFAGYGIYPDYKNFYAFHMCFDCRDTRKKCEAFLKESFEVVKGELIPTRKMPEITDEPIIWR
jgi:glutamate synthase domain-containing protein 1